MSLAIATSILRIVADCWASRESNWSRSSLVTPSTIVATSAPNSRSMSARVSVVSSTASWSSAAAIVTSSRPRPTTIIATPSGCTMYGSPDRRTCSEWAARAVRKARSIRSVSALRWRRRYAASSGASVASTG